jgi:hypothetical protein
MLLVVLASSTCGDEHFGEIVNLYRPQPHRDWGRARTAGNYFARDDKEPGPAGGNNYPETGLVKPPRRDTRALSLAGVFGGKAPLRLAAQKSGLHAPSAPMRSAPAYFLCKWEVQTRLSSVLSLKLFHTGRLVMPQGPKARSPHQGSDRTRVRRLLRCLDHARVWRYFGGPGRTWVRRPIGCPERARVWKPIEVPNAPRSERHSPD